MLPDRVSNPGNVNVVCLVVSEVHVNSFENIDSKLSSDLRIKSSDDLDL